MPDATRPEIVHDVRALGDASGLEVAARPLGIWSRLYANAALRKTMLLVALAAVWEIYARVLEQPAAVSDVQRDGRGACSSALASGEIPRAGAYTLSLLLKGYAVGLAIAACSRPSQASRGSARTCSRR